MPAYTSLPVPVAQDAQVTADLHPVGVVEAESLVPTRVSTPAPGRRLLRWLLLAMLLSAGAGGAIWIHLSSKPLPTGIISSNGRLEATEIDIATKLAGRIEAVLVQEGDFVERGQVVARMDTSVLRAQLHEAKADANRARMALATSKAVVEQRRHELILAQSILRRSQQLVQGHFISTEKLDTDQAQVNVATAALTAALSQVDVAKAATEAAGATIDRIQADIEDAELVAIGDSAVTRDALRQLGARDSLSRS